MRGTAPFGSLSVSSLRVACTAQLPIVSLQGSDHRSWLIAAALLLGLALDAFGGIGGQVAASALAWALLMFLVRRETAAWRVTLIAATAFACIAEVFFSLILGWYDYRFFNVPGFVPPGHVLLFMLGTSLARNVPDRLTNIIPPLAVAYAMFAVWSRWSSLDMLLLFLFLIAFYFGRARKTYAVMLILALALELLGTWLGSWRWQPEVMGLTTSNPPVLAGAAYVYFDAYVRTSARIIHRYMGLWPRACEMGHRRTGYGNFLTRPGTRAGTAFGQSSPILPRFDKAVAITLDSNAPLALSRHNQTRYRWFSSKCSIWGRDSRSISRSYPP